MQETNKDFLKIYYLSSKQYLRNKNQCPKYSYQLQVKNGDEKKSPECNEEDNACSGVEWKKGCTPIKDLCKPEIGGVHGGSGCHQPKFLYAPFHFGSCSFFYICLKYGENRFIQKGYFQWQVRYRLRTNMNYDTIKVYDNALLKTVRTIFLCRSIFRATHRCIKTSKSVFSAKAIKKNWQKQWKTKRSPPCWMASLLLEALFAYVIHNHLLGVLTDFSK